MSTTKWTLDPTHSELNFKVKHLMISNVKGEFTALSSSIEASDDSFKDAKIETTIDAASIFTNNTDRDNHLKSADFFETEVYPTITFSSTGFTQKSDDDYVMTGNITIKGNTLPISIDVEFGGINQDPWGNTKAGFSFNTKISRKEFGLTWNAALETGGVMVSDEVKIFGEVQFVKQA